jgi:hypothetical protein
MLKKDLNIFHLMNSDFNNQSLKEKIESESTSNVLDYDFDQYKQEFK